MIPSNLALHVGVVQKYNNNIVIADGSREIGENEDINPLDSAAAVNPRDSVKAVNPVDSAATVDSAAESTGFTASRDFKFCKTKFDGIMYKPMPTA